ncbi:hypothetical protein AB0L74_12875 [Streptomyces sp. NPDC052020]|uniref:vWA-MoxR associated conflict system protein n=1 Tax=Streptomyces sp. NPDC052020 TaxID=3155677 RepID=UPI003428544E
MTRASWWRLFGRGGSGDGPAGNKLPQDASVVPGPGDAGAVADAGAVRQQSTRVAARGEGSLGVGGHMRGNAVGDGSSVTYIGRQTVVQAPREGTSVPADVRRAMGRDKVAGALGAGELREAVAAWRPGAAVPAAVSFAQLLHWRRELDAEERPCAASDRVACAVAGLMECAVTAEFLADLLPGALTSERLSAAARLAGLPPGVPGADPLRDVLEYAVFEAQPLAAAPGAVLARVVAGLVCLARADRADTRLTEWAGARGLLVQLNDAIDEFTRPAPGLRLVISLADVRKGSGGEAEYWLTREGRAIRTGEPVSLAHDRTGVVEAIKRALAWAREHLGADEPLEHVDVAAPVSLLADLMDRAWALEDEPAGTFTLGARHSLLMRWSGRLGPDPSVPGVTDITDITEINDAARKALGEMSCRAEPVAWLDPGVFRPEAEKLLRHQLATGRLGPAIGFDENSPLDRALTTLLPYAPIVVWPRPGAPALDDVFRARVRTYWHRQPRDFADAYRKHESSHIPDTCLCDLHAVSHDETWLNFCWTITSRTVSAPKETW